jgi:hypothetical protein
LYDTKKTGAATFPLQRVNPNYVISHNWFACGSASFCFTAFVFVVFCMSRVSVNFVIACLQEGLALINGTQFICALTAEAVVRAELCAKQADIIAAVTMEAVRATPAPFAERVHTVRNQVA